MTKVPLTLVYLIAFDLAPYILVEEVLSIIVKNDLCEQIHESTYGIDWILALIRWKLLRTSLYRSLVADGL